jgi:hypothetical protein
VSLEELTNQPLKLIYGVAPPYESVISEVTTEDLHVPSEGLTKQTELLIISACYQLLWNLGDDEPPSEGQVAQLVRLLWDGRDC